MKHTIVVPKSAALASLPPPCLHLHAIVRVSAGCEGDLRLPREELRVRPLRRDELLRANHRDLSRAVSQRRLETLSQRDGVLRVRREV